MGKKDRPKQRTDAGFVMIMKEMIYSPAYKNLSNAARVSLILIMSDKNPKRKPPYLEKAGQSHDDLIFTLQQAEEFMKRNTFSKAVQELVEHGFITVWQHGTPLKKINFYVLSDMWQHYDTDKFKPQKIVVSGEGTKTKRVYFPGTEKDTVKGNLQYRKGYRK